MKRGVNCFVFALIVFAIATASSAATLSLTTGTAGVMPVGAPNDFLGPSPANLLSSLSSISGYYGATINYNVSGTAALTIDFFGGEANFHDQFLYNSGSGYVMPTGFDHPGNSGRLVASDLAFPIASFGTTLTGSGVLPFEFAIDGLVGGSSGGPVNGSNPLNTSVLPNFFVSCNPLVATGPTPTSCDSLWVFLDDNGGNHDNDHDDFAIRISLKNGVQQSADPVPEASSLFLLCSGLAGIGLFGLKLKK